MKLFNDAMICIVGFLIIARISYFRVNKLKRVIYNPLMKMNDMKLFIYFLFSLSTLYSQNSGIASYKILLPEYNKTEKNEGSNLMQQAKLVAENQIYILEFNDK